MRSPRFLGVFLLMSLFLGGVNPLIAQQLLDKTEEYNIGYSSTTPFYLGGGASMVDFNLDGMDDLSYTRVNQFSALFESSNGGFELEDNFATLNQFPKAIIWVDVENDGDLDYFASSGDGNLDLFEQTEEGVFINRIESSGIANDFRDYAMGTWGDYDLDGDLDLYLAVYDGLPSPDRSNLFYRNNGDFTFTEVSEEAGLLTDNHVSFQASWVDLNHDRYPDLFLINDRSNGSYFYLNNGDGTFTDISESTGVDLTFDQMSTSWGDFNQDGILDLYITNSMSGGNDEVPNHLYIGQEDITFVEAAVEYGVDLNLWTWGAAWVDIDNDSDLDLYVAEYWFADNQQGDHLYINQGPEENYFLQEQSELIQNNDSIDSHCIAYGDPNNDGYPDFAVIENSSFRYYENAGGENHYLKIDLQGVLSNRFGVGTWIDVWHNGILQRKYTFCGDNYLAQNSYTNFFGLGNNEVADSVIVEWPSGVVDRLFDVASNQRILIVEGMNYQAPPIPGESVYHRCEGDSLQLTYPFEDFIAWNDGSTNDTLTVNSSGTYFVLAQSELGVEANTASVEVTFHSPISPSLATEDPICFEENSGSLVMDLLNHQTAFFLGEEVDGNTLEGLSAGAYEVLIVDSFACEQSLAFELFEANEIISTLPLYTPLCDGNYERIFDGVQSGGEGALNILWNGLEEISAPGEYQFQVEDESGCTASFDLNLEPFDLLEVSALVEGVSDGALGSVVLDISGGFPPYEVLWSNDESEASIEELPIGTYSALVSDEQGCEQEIEVLITSLEESTDHPFHFYPNPFSGQLTVEGAIGDRVRVINLGGQVLMETFLESNKEELDLAQLSEGLYFISFENQRGNQQFLLVKAP
jgi:hypothetical protein